jgi:hypothetical protein
VGRSPFSIPNGDNSSRALTARILHSSPPRTQRPDVPVTLDLLLQQCLAKEPEHRPASSLEVARALQRIEAQAGYPRTMIAVETDLPVVQDVSAHATEDATVLKPVTVISGSSPRVAVDKPAVPTEEPAPTTRDRWRMLWLLAGAAVLLVVGLFLFLTAGDDDPTPPTATPSPTASSPEPLDPLAPTAEPEVTGRRTDAGVVFRWSSADGAETADTWQWRRTDTGEEDRTADTSLTLQADDRVCLQVRLIRGSFASPWGIGCVD